MFPCISHAEGVSALFAELRVNKSKSHPITEVLDGDHNVSDKAVKLCRAFMSVHYPGWNKRTKESK